MGAVTALMYGSKDLSIAGLVLDSPFSSLKVLINELAKSRVKLPDFIIKQAINWVKDIIKDKAGFNLDDIEPKEYAGKCFIPAYFCHSKGDTFVNIHHCKDLYNLYAGDKNIVYVKGNHNTERPIHFKDSVALFFYKALRCKDFKERYKKKEYSFDFHFNMENQTIFENQYLNDIKKKFSRIKNNNSNSEMKISLRGKYGKTDNINKSQDEKKDDKKKLGNSCKDIFPCLKDDIQKKNTTDSPGIKTKSNYMKFMYYAKHNNNNTQKEQNSMNNLIGPNFNSSILNKTPSKNIVDEDINIYTSQNEEEKIQKILQLSKKEYEEISTNTPILTVNNNNQYKKHNTIDAQKNINNKIFNNNTLYISNNIYKNISTNNNEIKNNNNVHKTLSIKPKKDIFSAENIFYINKFINKKEINNFSKKINQTKNINRNRINKINNNNKKIINNNIIKEVKKINLDKNNNAPFISSYWKFIKPNPKKINYGLDVRISQVNKNDIKNIEQNKIKAETKNNINEKKSFNNNSIHKISNIKNKNQKEEHKNIINNKKNDLLQKVIASPLNDHKYGNFNKFKQKINLNLSNDINLNNKKNNKPRKSESSIENESETIVNSRIDNKNDASIYLENDDNFFLEEDNVGINIPHF